MNTETMNPEIRELTANELQTASGGLSRADANGLGAILCGVAGPLAPIFVVEKLAVDLFT